jgi:hypothetical protein
LRIRAAVLPMGLCFLVVIYVEKEHNIQDTCYLASFRRVTVLKNRVLFVVEMYAIPTHYEPDRLDMFDMERVVHEAL